MRPLPSLAAAVVVVVALAAHHGSARAEDPRPCEAAPALDSNDEPYVGTVEGGYFGGTDVRPGDARTPTLWIRRGPAWHEYEGCVAWSLDATPDATFDVAARRLSVLPSATHDATGTVRARLADGRGFARSFRISDPARNPLAGDWTEEPPASACLGLGASGLVAQEFDLGANGRFSVTYTPFESYVDFWGRYTFDAGKRTVSFVVEDGNAVPSGYDGEGTFEVDAQGRLVLRGITFAGFPDSHWFNGYVLRKRR